jgi:hypothetical protein
MSGHSRSVGGSLRRVDIWAFIVSLALIIAQQFTSNNWLIIPWAISLLAYLLIPARYTIGRRPRPDDGGFLSP